ncbi:hypothetical protein PHET_12467 [Paragonimus heterotremus]|uniref:Uncharacterized protein n=1 Tax=Paragonimus heterotremus TaxID=100268 RepID=A0A8J4SYQ7_9TREM|nr:hypothetical protein PHET_12467 [Paragonimus heterotremus]
MFARLLRSSVISLNTSTRRLISSLVIVEHSDGKCDPVNLNAISAAKKFGEKSRLFRVLPACLWRMTLSMRCVNGTMLVQKLLTSVVSLT